MRETKKFKIEFETQYPETCWDCPAVGFFTTDYYFCKALFLEAKRYMDGEDMSPRDFALEFSAGQVRKDCPRKEVL
jgi:hypothetical protein